MFTSKRGDLYESPPLLYKACYKQGCGVGSPVIRLRLLAISIIRLRLQLRLRLRLRTDSDLQLY